jgi:hypothetical protein
MQLDVAVDIKSAMLAKLREAIDAAAPLKAKFKIYDGTKPSPGAAITSQVLLGECQCSYPCGSVVNGVFTFSAIIEEDLALATGIATWGRLVDGSGVYVADYDVGNTSSGAFLRLNNTSIFQGGIIRINVGVITI